MGPGGGGDSSSPRGGGGGERSGAALPFLPAAEDALRGNASFGGRGGSGGRGGERGGGPRLSSVPRGGGRRPACPARPEAAVGPGASAIHGHPERWLPPFFFFF